MLNWYLKHAQSIILGYSQYKLIKSRFEYIVICGDYREDIYLVHLPVTKSKTYMAKNAPYDHHRTSPPYALFFCHNFNITLKCHNEYGSENIATKLGLHIKPI